MEALANIGQVLTPIMKIAQPLMGIMGSVGNIMGGRTAAGSQEGAAAYQKQMDDLANNPAALAARINAVKQPLSTGLVQDVTNQVQAQAAERGLGSSPAQFAAIEGQALAPYEQNAQKMAIDTVMQMLGLPISAAGAVKPFKPADTSSLWKSFLPNANASGQAPAWTVPPSDPGITPPDPFSSGTYGGPASIPDIWGSGSGGWDTSGVGQ